MNKKLAILGHQTRGQEIIEILEMLGGKNDRNCGCGLIGYAYCINAQGIIDLYIPRSKSPRAIFTLEEFLEKFPYKVGDKVFINSGEDICTIKSMTWDEKNGRVVYRIGVINGILENKDFWFANEMERYLEQREETMEEGDKAMAPILVGEDYSGKRFGYKIPQGYEFDCIQNNEIIIKPIKPQYRKTYKESCDILGIDTMDNDAQGYKYFLIIQFQELLISRDAYWKIAGEQMGLDEPWKPDFTDTKEMYYIFYKGYIEKGNQRHPDNHVLIFPTPEMRDVFFENFKKLIEQCKELL